jgi:hypothetical protein
VDEPSQQGQKSYRVRNIALAVIVGAVLIAAGYRLGQAPRDTPAAVSGGEAPQTQAAMPGDAAAVTTSAGTGAIEVNVTYAGTAAALPEAAKVYVFIRPVGERMPLAVQTFAARELPVAVEFSHPKDASAGASVEAVARLSLSGAVALGAGDTEAISAPLTFSESTQRLQLELGEKAPTADAAGTLAVHVELGAGIALPGDTTVFLIVREAGGPPMPLAVRRLSVAQLPADVSLSDADAMMAGRTLSQAQSIEVVARTSRTGDVKGGPGDFEAHSAPLDAAHRGADAPLQLVIDQPL